MRADIIKTYKTLHTWTGLIAGMALFICFFAGAMTMFKGTLDRWATPPQSVEWVDDSQWLTLMQQTLATHPEAENGFVLNLRPAENVAAPLVWDANPERSHHDPQEPWGATLNKDGELVTYRYAASPMAQLVDMLHQTAGIPGEGHHLFGVYVMGVISVLYALAIVSGLVVLLPTLLKDFLIVRRGKNLKRFWLDAHNVVGITSLPFHIMIALTVIVFAFHDQLYAALAGTTYKDRPLFERHAPHERSMETVADNLLPPAVLLANLKETAPDFVPREMAYSNPLGERAEVRIGGENHDHMVRGSDRGFVAMDPYTGEVEGTEYLPGQEDPWTEIIITIFSLHFGSFGGDFMRWVYVFMGLAGAFIFYSGNLLWVETRRRKQRRKGGPVEQKRSTRLMASATIGVCWGAVAGVALSMSAGKWLYDTMAADTLYMWAYYVVFLASVAWAFWRGPGRGAVELIAFAGLAWLTVPFTALLAWLVPGIPAWVQTAPGTLAVDGSALVAGLLLLEMSRRTAKRVFHGNTDSVWYAGEPVLDEQPVEIKANAA
ncbi:MAG: peptidase [Alcanivoracaceae bacterium]|nr:peptidase [Alcanivoracaceae bacterium]